jgi:hypothetical protein
MSAIPPALLAMLGFVLGLGIMMLVWMIALHRRARVAEFKIRQMEKFPLFQSAFGSRPTCWLAVRSLNPKVVQAALGLDHFAPCPWAEGMTGGHGFFIGPPVNGWIIVTGSGLPNPGCDVDGCFYFLTELSRKLGQVQFFQAERILHQHAWIRVENGRRNRMESGPQNRRRDGIKHEMLWLRGTSGCRFVGGGGMDGNQCRKSPVAGSAMESRSGAHRRTVAEPRQRCRR